MTNEEFDNYNFTTKTEVKVDGEWLKIIAIDFDEHSVMLDVENYGYVECSEIDAVRNYD